MRRRFFWHSYAIVILLAACGGQTRRPDAAIEDCRVRAQAGAGEYSAGLQVCLVDQHGFKTELAAAIAGAERARAESMEQVGQPRLRWSYFDFYASQLRMTRSQGVDSAWIEDQIRRDSTVWRQVDSLMAQP